MANLERAECDLWRGRKTSLTHLFRLCLPLKIYFLHIADVASTHWSFPTVANHRSHPESVLVAFRSNCYLLELRTRFAFGSPKEIIVDYSFSELVGFAIFSVLGTEKFTCIYKAKSFSQGRLYNSVIIQESLVQLR